MEVVVVVHMHSLSTAQLWPRMCSIVRAPSRCSRGCHHHNFTTSYRHHRSSGLASSAAQAANWLYSLKFGTPLQPFIASTIHDSRFTIHVLSPLLLDFESRHQEPRICNRRHAATSRARHWGVGGFHNILFQSSTHRRTHFGIGRRNRLRLFREQW